MENFWVKFVLVMLSLGIINALWTWYIKFVNDGKAFQSAMIGESIFLIQAFTTISYVHDPRLIVAATIGGFVGTYLTIKFGRKKT